MTNLILKRAKFSRRSGQWQDEDYDVLADGKAIGRIYERGGVGTPLELRWFWSVPAIPNVTNGHARARKRRSFARHGRRLRRRRPRENGQAKNSVYCGAPLRAGNGRCVG